MSDDTYFDMLSESRDPKIVVNWIAQAVFGQLAARNQTFTGGPITVAQLGSLIMHHIRVNYFAWDYRELLLP